jgi:imidazolonepropionase-like amidohydrolase
VFVGGQAVSDDTRAAQAAYRFGHLLFGAGGGVERGLVVIEDGKFALVGAGDEDRKGVREMPDAWAMPGMVDGFTRLAMPGGAAEDVEALTPDVRAVDGFDAKDRSLEGLAAQGTTTLGIGPAPANLAAGRAGVVRLSAGGKAEVVAADGPPVFAFQAPALRTDRVPATLAGARRLLAAAFAGERWSLAHETEVPVRPEALACLRDVAPGPAIAWADTVASARAAVETLRAKKLDPALVGLRSAWTEPDAIAALGAPCVVTALGPDDPAGLLELPAKLHAKGVAVALSTSAPDRSQRSLRRAMALAVANGLPGVAAVEAVTGVPAKILGVDARVGRVANRRDADLVVFDGPPWEPRSRLLLVLAKGETVYERREEEGR